MRPAPAPRSSGFPTRSSSRACGPNANRCASPPTSSTSRGADAGAPPAPGSVPRRARSARDGGESTEAPGRRARIALADAGHVPAVAEVVQAHARQRQPTGQPLAGIVGERHAGGDLAPARAPARSAWPARSHRPTAPAPIRHRSAAWRPGSARSSVPGAARRGSGTTHSPAWRTRFGARSVSLHPRAVDRPAAGRRRSPGAGPGARRRGPARPAPAHRSARRARRRGASTGSSAVERVGGSAELPGHGQVVRRDAPQPGIDVGCAVAVASSASATSSRASSSQRIHCANSASEGGSSSRLKAARRTPFSPCWAAARSTSYQLSPITVGAVSPRSRSHAPKAATRAGMAVGGRLVTVAEDGTAGELGGIGGVRCRDRPRPAP